MRALFKVIEIMEIWSRAVPARLLGSRSMRKGEEEEEKRIFWGGGAEFYTNVR